MAKKPNILNILVLAAIFIALEVAALAMLKNSGEAQNAWISKGLNGVNASVWGTTEKIGNYFNLRKQNDSLAAENFRLHQLLMKAQIEDSGDESGELVGSFHFIPASIVKHSSNSQHNYLILDKGSMDNVIAGSGVITPQGVIGKVDAVSEHYAHVVSFCNTETVVSARLGRADSSLGVGTLKWDGIFPTGAILSGIPFQTEIEVGDTVYTSGYSSIYPPDIPLGVTGESKLEGGSQLSFEVELFEDIRKVRYVTITSNNDRLEIQRLSEEGYEDQ